MRDLLMEEASVVAEPLLAGLRSYYTGVTEAAH